MTTLSKPPRRPDPTGQVMTTDPVVPAEPRYCKRCGLPLTRWDSKHAGYGKTCAGKVSARLTRRRRKAAR